MATKPKQDAASGRKVTSAATKETTAAAKETTVAATETTAAVKERTAAAKETTVAAKETVGAEQFAKTAAKTSAGSATRKSDKVKSFDEQTIQARAYWIWLEEGQPEGRDVEHWQRACEELEREA
jgi:Protein of unknown function (DUF2934)